MKMFIKNVNILFLWAIFQFQMQFIIDIRNRELKYTGLQNMWNIDDKVKEPFKERKEKWDKIMIIL